MIELWLKHVRQEGLVVAQTALNDTPVEQTADDTEAFKSSTSDFWSIARNVLEWPDSRIARGAELPGAAVRRLTEMNVTLTADAALIAPDEPLPRLLIKLLEEDEDPDKRGAIDRWEGVTQQQAFERHLRESGVEQGVLVTDKAIRLTYAPVGETAGFLEWPLDGMATTAGRPMLGGLKLVLGKNAIWGPDASRLSGVLKRSRENQNTVSTELAEQVLGALYTLLRGFTAQFDDRVSLQEVARKNPQLLYEGLLTVLLRLVFILYAEDRDLVPSADNADAKSLYDKGYSVRGLFGQLEEDASFYPDTMGDRYGAWGRLLGLFKLVYEGAGRDFMHARRGKLFDPAVYPFLLGQYEADDKAEVLAVSDKCVHEVLKQLLILGGERLSYKTLDVEQIGSVYETVMGFTVERTTGTSVALKVKPSSASKQSVPAFIDLDRVLLAKPDKRKKLIADAIDYSLTAAQDEGIKKATTIDDLLAALDKGIDIRACPGKKAVPAGTIILQPTDERRSTGSHYTPRALTGPIVRDALAPVLAQLGEAATPDDVLNLKICDPAMGSGAFLVEACRVVGEKLQAAWSHHRELLPDEARRDPQTYARREVAKRCLFGVDKNPMATDLAKLSLWLVTLARDEDFSFLDHALKTGDSLVGLSVEQIKGLTWNDPKQRFLFASAFDKAVDKALEERRSIRTAPDNVTFEIQKHHLKMADKELEGVRLAGDAVIGVYFSEKKDKAREKALDEMHRGLTLGGEAGWDKARQHRASLKTGAHPLQSFHWPVEFPEVFAGDNPGFHSIVGNPPFAGKNTVSKGQREGYTDWLQVISPGAHGNSDLVTHFFRRAFAMLRDGGTFGLIATNTISQGDTRESGLRYLLVEGRGWIYRATRRKKWPGAAAVVVSTVHMQKGATDNAPPELDGKPVSRISAFLREGDEDETPAVLKENEGIAFQGSIILGMGFTFDDANAKKGKCEPLATMHRLIAKDPKNAERIKPYLGGEEVNTDPEHKHHRYVIDFEDFPLRRDDARVSWAKATEKQKAEMLRDGVVPRDFDGPVAADWPDLLEIVERLVKPERDKDQREIRRRKWWLHGDRQPALFSALSNRQRVAVTPRVKMHHFFAKVSVENYFANTLYVFVEVDDSYIGVLSSRIHELWMRTFAATLGDALNYAPSDCLDTFAFPNAFLGIEPTTAKLLSERAKMMAFRAEGLTDTYTRLHDSLDREADIEELRRLHAAMDDAVLRAYGWDDLADLAKGEAHPRFLKEEEEPEFAYQGRLFWPAWFRDKVLARLLELNRERAAAEANAAKTDTGKKLKPKALQLDPEGTLL